MSSPKKSSQSTTHVVIAGAGLDGLEATSTLDEIGAGIQLSPNCSRLLIR